MKDPVSLCHGTMPRTDWPCEREAGNPACASLLPIEQGPFLPLRLMCLIILTGLCRELKAQTLRTFSLGPQFSLTWEKWTKWSLKSKSLASLSSPSSYTSLEILSERFCSSWVSSPFICNEAFDVGILQNVIFFFFQNVILKRKCT